MDCTAKIPTDGEGYELRPPSESMVPPQLTTFSELALTYIPLLAVEGFFISDQFIYLLESVVSPTIQPHQLVFNDSIWTVVWCPRWDSNP